MSPSITTPPRRMSPTLLLRHTNKTSFLVGGASQNRIENVVTVRRPATLLLQLSAPVATWRRGSWFPNARPLPKGYAPCCKTLRNQLACIFEEPISRLRAAGAVSWALRLHVPSTHVLGRKRSFRGGGGSRACVGVCGDITPDGSPPGLSQDGKDTPVHG